MSLRQARCGPHKTHHAKCRQIGEPPTKSRTVQQVSHARVFTCNCAFGAATACQNSLFNDKAATCLSRTGRGKCSVSASAGFAPPLIFESSRRMLVTAPKNQKQNRRDVSHVGVTLWNITETVMINLRLGGIVFGPCFCRLVLRVTVLQNGVVVRRGGREGKLTPFLVRRLDRSVMIDGRRAYE